MKTFKKVCVFLLMFMLCINTANTASFAQTSTQDGLEVNLTTDKQEYEKGDKIKVNLEVTNTNNEEVKDVCLENIIPDGYKLADDTERAKEISSLKPGEVVKLTTVFEMSDGNTSDDNNGGGASGNEDDNGGTSDNKNNNGGSESKNPNDGSNVKTGDNNNIVFWSIAFLGSVLILVIIFARKKISKKLFFFGICTVMAGSMAFGKVANVYADEKEYVDKTIDISEKIIVDGKEIELKSKVIYNSENIKNNGVDIDVDTSNIIYDEENKVYYFKDNKEVSLKGTITGDVSKIKDIKYEIFDDHNISIKNGNIEALEKWELKDLGLMLGKNTVIIKCILNDGNIIEKSIILMNANNDCISNLEIDENDNDGDGLINYLENYYGTDKNKKDTDGDGLDDYIELEISQTDPLKSDTNDNGVSDAQEDNDKDGLKNIEELNCGTDLSVKDTDGDEISDFDEIKKYNTNPTLIDTDGDGANDGWEILNKYDPLVANKSFDVDNVYSQDNGKKIKVSTNLSGEQISSFNIEKYEDINFNENIPGLLGDPIDISVYGNISSAKLSIEFDKDLLNDSSVVPVIYYYNSDEQLLEPLDTIIDGNIATTTLNHFSRYVLLNKTEVDKVWDVDIKKPNESVNNLGMSISFVIDRSQSMDDNDASGIRKTVTSQFIDKLENEKDLGSVISFIAKAEVLTGLTNDIEELKKAVDSIENDSGYGYNSGTNGSAGIHEAIQQLIEDKSGNSRYIIFMTDGEDNRTSYSYDELIDVSQNNNITIYTIGLGSANEEILKKLADQTGGKYYYATEANDLFDVFEDTKSETIDFRTDSNNDGISDYYTKLLCQGKLKTGTGIKLFEGISYEQVQANSDYDGDGLKNGDEVSVYENGGKIYMKIFSSPTIKDTDEDGWIDSKDKNPRTWDVGDRDLAIFAALAYEDASFYKGKMYKASDIKGSEDEPGESYYFLSGASIGGTDEGISNKWKIEDYVNIWSDIDTYFSATTFKNGNNVVIAYRGTNEKIGEWVNNLLGVGLLNYHSEEMNAQLYALKIAKMYPNCKIYITGHSLGGYLAQIGGSIIIDKKDVNVEKIAYFNGIGLKYNKASFWSKDKDIIMKKLRNYSRNNPLISYEIYGDVVSALGTHSGDERSFYANEQALKHHAGKHGTDFWSSVKNYLSKAANIVLSIAARENLNKYYDYYNVKSIMEYFWVTHETDSFYYNLNQGDRG